jgi:hypothetical protein
MATWRCGSVAAVHCRNALADRKAMEQGASWKVNWFSTSPEINRKCITTFTNARHLSLSYASSNQSIPPHSISWRSILVLSSHLHLDLQSDLFPSGVLTKTLYIPLLYPIRATCPSHLIFLDLITRTILFEQYRSLSSLCSFLRSLVTVSRLGLNIILSTLFSVTLSLRSSLSISDQVFTLIQNNRQNYSSVYLNLEIFEYQPGRQNIVCRMIASIPWFLPE